MKSLLPLPLLMLFAAFAPGEETKKTPLHEHPTLVSMLATNNSLRAGRGLAPHRMSAELTQAAQDHAWYMAKTGNFSHQANGGPMARAKKYGYAGLVRENIANGQTTVSGVFTDWKASSGHWANICSDTSEAGFGYAIAPNGSTYWVAVYGP